MSQLPPAIICIGRNYAAHASEFGHDALDLPLVFFKNPSALTGNGDPIVIPEVCAHNGPQVDYEGELAVVIGKDALDVSASDAMAHVAGYAVANDVSARWWQTHGSGGQYSRGKSFDTFCPMTEMVPAATVPDPQDLRLTTRLNGDIVQDTSTADMIFPVATLIEELSRGMTLLAGTLLLTGTPAGVGSARDPKCFLRDGDVVEVEIEKVGTLKNTVVIHWD
ncbi:MAG: fumarylacetoacetate hydrolase family protein [Phycisphaerales bacterium]|jgi:2-keto-4-pentenoate hydratase/2-oxohepta-3-ene-1,7-dioic acid hydratase in catechol pathway|nr:fumarylacetoacetate hydrolase family protein [Phycisphaerales bacterium]